MAARASAERIGPGMRRRDWAGLGLLVLWLPALILYRHAFVEPRSWVAACEHGWPTACGPRAALLFAQRNDLLGLGAVALGLWAFLGGRFAVRLAAVALGIAGVVNYNVTWGMLGAALGAWAWLRPPRSREAADSGAGPDRPAAAPQRSRSAPAG